MQEPEDIKALLLAWKMEARNMGYFSKEEFFTGLRRLGADSLETLSRAIHDLDKEVSFQPLPYMQYLSANFIFPFFR